MRVAVFAKVFSRPNVNECLAAVADADIQAVQFNLSVLGLETVPEAAPEPILSEAKRAFEATGVDPIALSGTFNAAHPDPAIRERYVARFPILCKAAATLGIPLVTLSTGSRDAEDMWRSHPDNSTPQAWADSLDTLRKLAVIAADHGIKLAFEPERNNVVSTAQLAVEMLEQIGSDSVGTIFDGANLLTETTVREHAIEAVIIDAARRLEGMILLAHAKELRFPEQEVPAGSGVVSWPVVVEQLAKVGYDGPLVIHGLREADVPTALSTLRPLVQERRGGD
jgi:sugar phosphate isomerase/epimerase